MTHVPGLPPHVPQLPVVHAKVQPDVSLQLCSAAGFAPAQNVSSTATPSERWQVTVRFCVPPPQVLEHAPQPVVVHA